jgi:hypothetical protein
MLPDPPDCLSEKPLLDLDPGPADRPVAPPPPEADFPGRSLERFTRETYAFVWNGPTGPVTVTVTDYGDYFGVRHEITIGIPPGTLFPLDDLSFPVGAHEIACAGDAGTLVQNALLAAERTDYWKDAVARAAQGDLFGALVTLDAPARPRRRRGVPPRPAPRR